MRTKRADTALACKLPIERERERRMPFIIVIIITVKTLFFFFVSHVLAHSYLFIF